MIVALNFIALPNTQPTGAFHYIRHLLNIMSEYDTSGTHFIVYKQKHIASDFFGMPTHADVEYIDVPTLGNGWKRILFEQTLFYRYIKPCDVFYSYCALGLAVWLCWMGSWREPFIDFRPFTPGTNLKEAVMGEGQEQTTDSDSEWVCIYQRNGVRQEFSLDNLPDEAEGWEFVETIERHADGKVSDDRSKAEPKHIDFFVKTADGEVITDELLSRPGYTLLLLSHSLDKASQHDIDRIELLSEYAGDNDYGFLCLTARDEKQLERWKFNTGAEYPFVFTDASIIETMCRANPAVMLLRDGVICWKTPLSRLDAEGLTSGKLNEQTSGDIEEINYHNRILLVLFLLFAPFFLFLLVEIVQFLHKQTLKNNSKKCVRKS